MFSKPHYGDKALGFYAKALALAICLLLRVIGTEAK